MHFLEPEFRIDTSHLITEDDEPSDNPFQECWRVRLSAAASRGSQWALDPGCRLDAHRYNTSRAYFVWEYGKPPDLVIEVVSKEPGEEGVGKLQIRQLERRLRQAGLEP